MIQYKLQAYLIDGQKVGIDLHQWNDSDLEGNSPFIFAETLHDGYADISSIENLMYFARDNGTTRDNKFVREQIAIIMYSKCLPDYSQWFTHLTENERRICCMAFLAPTQLRNEFFTIEEQITLGDNFDHCQSECRKNRYKKIRSELFNRLDWSDTMELLAEFKHEIEEYLEGKEGTIAFNPDPEGFLDVINSTPGTSYENIGLRNKTYQVIGFNNCSEFADHLLDICLYGNYTYNI